MIDRNEAGILFSNKSLRNLILPLIIEQFLAVAIGVIDTAMVASCGEAAVSGISLVDSINFLLITIFSSFATGGAVVAAQYIGKGEKWNANIVAKQLEIFALFISIIIMIFSLVFRDFALGAIFGKIDANVMENARIYFFLSALSYPFLAVYNSGAALFRAMGDSRTSMLISILMNLINVTGNTITIFGLGMGVFGAALATLIARAVGAILITVLLLNPDRAVFLDMREKFSIRFDMIRKICKIGLPNGLENSIFQIGKILTTSIVSSLGTVAITANAVAGNYASLQNIPGTAVGMSLLTIVGQCVGAKDFDAAKMYTKKLIKITYIAAWAITVPMLFLLPFMQNLYSLSDATYSQMSQLFLIHACFAVVIWPLSFALPNALRAAGDAKYTMIISLLSMWIFRIGLSYLFVFVFRMGVTGIWVAMCVDWVFRSILFVSRFVRGKWKNRSIV